MVWLLLNYGGGRAFSQGFGVPNDFICDPIEHPLDVKVQELR